MKLLISILFFVSFNVISESSLLQAQNIRSNKNICSHDTTENIKTNEKINKPTLDENSLNKKNSREMQINSTQSEKTRIVKGDINLNRATKKEDE